MVIGQEMDHLSTVSGTKITKHIEPRPPTPGSIPSKAEVPIHADLEAPMAEPSFIAWKESAVPIVEEPLLQEV